MADVVRILPRHWDGPRLLRFLTGLALLALAFAVHAGPATTAPAIEAPANAVTTSTVTTTVDVPASVAEPVAPATPGESSAPARAPRFARTIVPAGAHPGVHGSRGPPLA